MWSAPLIDDIGNIIVKEKKFKELFKNKKYGINID